MMNISNIAIRINKKLDTLVEYNNKTMSIFDFIDFYFKKYIKSVNNTTFKEEKYVDYVIDYIYDDENYEDEHPLTDKLEKIIKDNGEKSGFIQIFKHIDSSACFSYGNPYDIGLDVSKGVDFVFLES